MPDSAAVLVLQMLCTREVYADFDFSQPDSAPSLLLPEADNAHEDQQSCNLCRP